jgi:hypothetical protein
VPDSRRPVREPTAHSCTCGNGEAEEDRGAVIACAVHGIGQPLAAFPAACAYCHGDGEACNPGNADPSVRVVDWLAPVICPRCGGTGKERS